MFHLDNTSGVPEMPTPKEAQSLTPRWFGESVQQGGISWPGADWFNIVQAELLAILALDDVEPSKEKHDQISTIIKKLVNSLPESLTGPDGYKNIGEASSFDELRTLPPSAEGVKIKLRGWNNGSAVGGGEFVGHFGNAADDGGVVAAGDGFYWARCLPIFDDLTIEHFGAILDGTADCHDAIIRMHNWSQNTNSSIGIRVPAGVCYSSPIDISATQITSFRLRGMGAAFGYLTATRWISDGSSTPMITVNARYAELTGIRVDGKNTAEDVQGFYKNIIKGGQFLRAKCLQFRYMGGVSLDIIDSLDTKIDQWYANNCKSNVIRNTWSNTVAGNWNHTTAVELTNFNCQNCPGAVLNMQRCLQAMIYNGWMERCNPGDISQGHWVVQNLSLEACSAYGSLNAVNSRLTEINTNLVSSTINRGVNSDTSWVGAYQLGQVRIEPYGVDVNGHFSAKYQTSQLRFKNDTANRKWLYVGKFYIPTVGQQVDIEAQGQCLFSPASTNSSRVADVNSGSRALIRIQRTNGSTASVSWHAEGSSPVYDVQFTVGGGGGNVFVYLLLDAWVQAGSLYIKTNTLDNFYQDNDLPWFTIAMTSSDTAPGGALKAVRKVSLHTGSGGIGVAHDGQLMVDGPDTSSLWTIGTTPLGYIQTMRNGELVAIPYYKITK
ncbi:amylovoran biosynthesis protein AmsF [Serratia marcescens]|uniref:amylovoran biosynthesis protein AmsF n=1 Tax=Serratia marcescens TaxID=615 RepID=UPI001EF4B9C2|nr:amylovoran biosynthesis protein AmsF [Serratia marcescens]MDP8616455.1 amylovoran biosynthesis protein AmsF [Serratia marcescens]MDP8646582.1 amylovoran biosynthesis protein AmsF [Serratia marcescens]MDP8656508.1 amylovoran biosynthesis protein AmsF [Serratia marcescens]MDP8661492.1 amylovoran biosynthesis protein AmsF [Serratia marcescens]MDP8720732.1 amylovoran biosynthesis protein AmsF [Serratia marcescens]